MKKGFVKDESESVADLCKIGRIAALLCGSKTQCLKEREVALSRRTEKAMMRCVE